LAVTRGLFLVNLAVLPDLQAYMLLVVKNLTRHNSLRAEEFRNSSLSREIVEHPNAVKNNVDCH
jgi:hypothetical protein